MPFHAQIIWTEEPEQYVFETSMEECLDGTFTQFTIDDARELKKNAYQTALISGTGRLFVVRSHAVTIEAQHALLKLLEEPPPGVRIVFILRQGITLLPTVLSRCQTTDTDNLSATDTLHTFLTLSYAERLALIDRYHTKKDTEWFGSLQAGLGQWLAGTPADALSLRSRQSLQAAYSLLGTRGASNKMLAEHIALSLPVSVP